MVAATPELLAQIMWFFTKAGAFVFGSGLAIVPFLYGGVVQQYGWLTDKQFLDAVAVAMLTPGPIVITVAFIGYLGMNRHGGEGLSCRMTGVVYVVPMRSKAPLLVCAVALAWLVLGPLAV